ncbi:alpha amylase, catalytic domain protein [Lysobacter antibioticus]|uniref:Alpha amylase, catalytic domain protein n=1 Tax=Lysobacter antibioticus TaxID=84531 RepID=A0A0S2FGK5_LYSAN|nr:alpha amylase, catalytic domain protein [Lysobacter antibioticus]
MSHFIGRLGMNTYAGRQAANAPGAKLAHIAAVQHEDRIRHQGRHLSAVNLPTPAAAHEHAWWRGAVIYQIYPRSFRDLDGDGVGDLPGIIDKLGYVADLGVDAIWISPFFKSPMADFGYDIADYRAVDPLFGDLDDFDRLLAKAHALGLRVMIDQVLSHTSDQHEWFKRSRESRDNDYADWYVWADASPDGTAPNNWMSLFGGVAWRWEPRRQQYYLHNFLSSQPDLNFHNPDVRAAVLDNVRFWLDRGVDGLRLDAINFCFHDAQLRDNPPKPAELRVGRGFSPDNPYAFQYHYYNNTRPENLAFLAELRALLDRYPGAVALGEISSEDSLATSDEYTRHGRLHMGYSFELLTDDRSAGHIRGTVQTLENAMREGWPCWSISNHDVQRVVTRWGRGEALPAHYPSLLNALVCSLRGSVCVYQGEELGLPEAELPFEALQDPYGKTFWPTFKGRDGCRTPMPWDGTPQAGFSTGTPWLPIAEGHRGLDVARQQHDPDSSLNRFRRFLSWRKTRPALLDGAIRFLASDEPVLAFVRGSGADAVLMAFNLGDAEAELTLPEAGAWHTDHGHGLPSGERTGDRLRLPPYGVFAARAAG